MYPIDMTLAPPHVGFAVANDAAEHQELTAKGFGPAFVPAPALAEPGAGKVAKK